MFEQKSLNKIDGDYFNIIIADSQDDDTEQEYRSLLVHALCRISYRGSFGHIP